MSEDPTWIRLDPPGPGKTITRAIDAEAKKLVMRNLGRRWTRRHDIAWTAFMVRNGYLPAESLDQARQEYAEERATAKQHRHEAGHTPNHGFRVW